jgi:hypothetical protein
MDPAGEGDGLADVRGAQFVAMMGSLHLIRGCLPPEKERGCLTENEVNSTGKGNLIIRMLGLRSSCI